MNYRRFGALARAVRKQLGLRQVDVATGAGVSQRTVSRIERADCGQLAGDTLQAVADVLSIRLGLDASWRGARGDRLVDSAHAALVEAVVRALRESAWTVRVEYSFSYYGERGIVDVLGWREREAALLIVEVKSELGDLQETLGRLDVKARVVPRVAADLLGQGARRVGVVLVLPERTSCRERVSTHAATFDAALPNRTVAVRRWLAAPESDLRAVWFLRHRHGEATKRNRDRQTRDP